MLTHSRSISLLRFCLAIMFIWFGLLKIYHASPVINIIHNIAPSFPDINILIYAVIETAVGVLLLGRKTHKAGAIIMIIILVIGTIQVLSTQGFTHQFPFLSLQGEFVVKNIGLIAAGFAIITEKNIVNEGLFEKSRDETYKITHSNEPTQRA